ncbi:MAG TPA: asparagine synthase (glutamine-hydrolyzing) [Gemmatimonadales bacterium]|nr:asparagine synthase (glutamine-hydrolyzing) [Gemmatimonadales bacterium]
MCGLAGIVRGSGAPPTSDAVTRSLAALAHRGPDAHRVWREGPCTLLHTRLRVIDLAPRSDQPMVRARDREVAMAYNGEIYNYRTLRSQLEQQGWSFSTSSDAEVLLQGYLAWGVDVFRRARGMWAVAFWHSAEQRLVLSRDPLGKKPLLYAARPGGIVFGSNVSAILPLLETQPAVDRAAIDCYLAHLVVPFEHSVFQGIDKVPPGTVVSWTAQLGPTVERFWRVPENPVPGNGDAVGEVERLLRQAVRRRLESDVPIGVFLSAGYDSGLVAALAAQESRRRLLAVTAGTRGSGYDERAAARPIAERYGLEHQELEVPPLSAAHLPALLSELGEPFGDASLLPSYEVARAARRQITVALTGDGGDEAFFGYGTFRAAYWAVWYRRLVPGGVRRVLEASTRGITGDSWRRRAAAMFEYGADSLATTFRNRMGFASEQRTRLMGDHSSPGAHRAEHVYAERLTHWNSLNDADALRRTFFETFLPNDYLTKVDTATMAASLEARSPFLDVDLVEYVLQLPLEVSFPRGRLKALLRPIVRRHLPLEVLHRPKTGFGVPVGDWLRGPLGSAFEEFVCRPGTLMADLVAPDVAREFLHEHRLGADHGTRLWTLLALGVWAAVVGEGRWAPDEPLPISGPAAVR